jgi:hypothetical protein
MDASKIILELAQRYVDGTGLAVSTVATRIFNDGKELKRLHCGGDIGVRRYARALQWFSDHWPAGVAWPEGIARPEPSSGGEGV